MKTIDDLTFPLSLDDFLALLSKELFLIKVLYFCDKHHIGFDKLVSLATQSPGNNGLIKRVIEGDAIKLATMKTIERFMEHYWDELPKRF